MFFFTSLALIKRYVDLAVRVDGGLPDPTNRNYRKSDLATVGALAAASGLNAVTIFALYISSETVHRLYRHPHALWLVCPGPYVLDRSRCLDPGRPPADE